ncbi:MAG TPA: hypothetical protein VE487_05485 [Ilumatobacter sp.]|nr:hypothetical protein [Ilumatobacter sp.]
MHIAFAVIVGKELEVQALSNVVLLEQREPSEVVERLHILGPDSCSDHGLAVVGHVDIRVLQQPLELRKLDFLQFGSRQPLALPQIEVQIPRSATDEPFMCWHSEEIELEQGPPPAGVRMVPRRYSQRLGRNPRAVTRSCTDAELCERRREVAERLPNDSPNTCVDERSPRVAALEERFDLEDRVPLCLRRDRDERLKMPVLAAVVENVNQHSAGSEEKSGLVVASAHSESRVEEQVEHLREHEPRVA